MRSKYIAAVAVLASVLAAGVGRTVVTAQADKMWSGVFTADQATSGKDEYNKICSDCHGVNLKGGDLAPPLVGDEFIGHWYDAQLSELTGKVALTMPANMPGSLKPEEYENILAYLFQANGFPAGKDKLKLEPVAALDAIKITKKP